MYYVSKRNSIINTSRKIDVLLLTVEPLRWPQLGIGDSGGAGDWGGIGDWGGAGDWRVTETGGRGPHQDY